MKTETIKSASTPARPDDTSEHKSQTSKHKAKRLAKTLSLVALAAFDLGLATGEARYLTSPVARPLPKIMPEAVRTRVASAVKVITPDGVGSGVKIEPNLVLTAGHVVSPQKSTNIRNGDKNNGYMILDKYDHNIRVKGLDAEWLKEEPVIGWAGSAASSGDGEPVVPWSSHMPDFALLKVRDSQAFDKVPSAKLAKRQPEKGDPVFLINYQTNDSHTLDRYPTEQQAKAANADSTHTDGHPSEVGGLVIGDYNGFTLIATGMQAYGAKQDQTRYVYEVSSGGPVFNNKGELIGLSVGGAKYPAVLSAILAGERLPMPSTSEASYDFIQPVTPDLIRHYEASLPQ